MEHQKILNLLNVASDAKFVTRNWNIFNDQSNAIYIIYSTEVLTTNLCEYNGTYILINRQDHFYYQRHNIICHQSCYHQKNKISQNILAKDLKKQCRTNITKSENKNTTNKYRYFFLIKPCRSQHIAYFGLFKPKWQC